MNEKGPERPKRFNPLTRRYAEISRGGKERFSFADTFPLFEGFSEDLQRRFSVWLSYDKAGIEAIQTRVCDVLARAEKELGFSFYLAGRDYPLHTTLMQGAPQIEPDSEREKTIDDLASDKHLQDVAPTLEHGHVRFRYPLTDNKGNVILVSTEFPQEVSEARERVASSYRELNLKPIPIQVLHISIARIRKLPDNNAEEALKELSKRVEHLRKELFKSPIDVEIEGVHLARGTVSVGEHRPLRGSE